jgi:branched-chain amino acid transport system substrate-binding protein
LGALVFALGLVAVACGGDEQPSPGADGGGQECTWTLGTIGALSGDAATIGVPIFEGIEYAVDEVNKSGELACTIELQAEDSQGSPDQAPPLAQRLVENEELVAIVGPYFSGETLATGDIYSDAGVAFICPSCTNETIDDQGFATFFRAVANDAVQGPTAAEYIRGALNPSVVAVVHDNQDYSKGLAETVARELGDIAKGPFVINPEETDYSAVVSQVADTNPDVVYYGGYVPQAGPLAKQLHEAGVDAVFVSDDGTKDAAFGELAGPEAADGAIVTCPCVDPTQIPAAQDFVDGMRAAYGEEAPGTFAADAYDAARLVFEALKDFGPDDSIEDVRAGVVEFLKNVEGYQGIAKTYTFDDKGEVVVDPLQDIWIYEWSNEANNFVSLGPAAELL